MRLEGPHNFQCLRKNADMAIIAADEEIIRSRTYTIQIVALATSALKQTARRRPTDSKE